MHIFFWFCFCLLIPGMILRIPFEGAGILATDIFVPIFSITWLSQKILLHKKFPTNYFLNSGLIFGCFAFFSFLLGAWDLEFKQQILSFSFLVRFLSILIFGVAAGNLFVSQKDNFFHKFFLIIFCVIFLGFLQFYFFPNLGIFSTEGGWDPHIGRLLSTWLDPNFIAGFLGIVLPIIIARFFDLSVLVKKNNSKIEDNFIPSLNIKNNKFDKNFGNKQKYVYLFLFFLCLIALFLTFSRSGFLSAMIGLFVFFIFKKPQVIFLGILVGIIGIFSNERAQNRMQELSGTVAAIIFQDTDEIDATARLRIESWQKSLELFYKYPLFGIGFNTYRFRAAEEGIVNENFFSAGGSDSSHISILVTTGIFGSLAFFYFLGVLFFRNFYRFLIYKRSIYLGFSCSIISIFVHSFFVNSLLYPFIFMSIMAIGGVLEKNKDVR